MSSSRLRWAVSIVLAVAIVPLFACASSRLDAPADAAAPAAPAAANAAASAAEDSANFDTAAALAELRRSIAGRENMRADSVWKNLKVLDKMPAGRVLSVMEMGYSRSLGVNCLHCHVSDDWASDRKRPKGVTRDMALMSARINNELLEAIPNLQSEKPAVNCTTCHRGQVKPALNLASE